MRLLYANDQAGKHAPSWYHDTCDIPARSRLERHLDVDVVIVGAGFTGLSAAREIARRGMSVVVLDAHRVGWGASGRNGGQLGSGYNMSQPELESLLGRDHAHRLWDLSEAAKAEVLEIASEANVDIEYQSGIIQAVHRKRYLSHVHAYAKTLKRDYGYDAIEPLNRAQCQALVSSDDYVGGTIDHGAGHVHPLKLCQALAQLCEKHGAIIHEQSEVIRIDKLSDTSGTPSSPGTSQSPASSSASSRLRAVTANGSVTASRVLLAGNGYLDTPYEEDKITSVAKHVMPINSFIVVTEPLGEERASSLLPGNHAVADSRFVVRYFRRLKDSRLLFGGGENYSYRFPNDISRSSQAAMLDVFPDLHDVNIDYAWGGTLAITRSRLPYVRKISPALYTAGGYSGHGVALATLTGRITAEAMAGDNSRFKDLAALPTPKFPGGVRGRDLLLRVAMGAYSLGDKL